VKAFIVKQARDHSSNGGDNDTCFALFNIPLTVRVGLITG
jgi:hypothetical protein